ncbi:MAG: hypothetical protein RLN75_06300 [Longimicrobiales bacterium]
MARPFPLRAGLRACLLVAVCAGTTACTTQTVQSGSGAVAGTSPLQSVERFLAAVNARDLDDMMAVFGTREGPIRGDRAENEIWMDAIASILEHRRYEIVSERQVPGREFPTTRVGVTLTIGGEVYPDVTFITIRTDEGRWMVQEVDLERITGN